MPSLVKGLEDEYYTEGKDKEYWEIFRNQLKLSVPRPGTMLWPEITTELKSMERSLMAGRYTPDKILRNTKLNINNIKMDVADFNNIRKSQLGKFRLANDGMGVDVFYEELSNSYPGYFDKNITNPTDQLLSLIEWRNFTENELLKAETYKLTNEDLTGIANYILQSKEYLNSLKQDNNIKYSVNDNQNERLSKLNENFDLSVEIRDQLYDQRDELQKQYDELTQSQEYKDVYKRLVKMTDMSKMFYYCTSLREIDLSSEKNYNNDEYNGDCF